MFLAFFLTYNFLLMGILNKTNFILRLMFAYSRQLYIQIITLYLETRFEIGMSSIFFSQYCYNFLCQYKFKCIAPFLCVFLHTNSKASNSHLIPKKVHSQSSFQYSPIIVVSGHCQFCKQFGAK